MAIGCPDCGTVQTIPPLPPGAVAECRTCALRLERTSCRSLDLALSGALSTLLLLLPADGLPLMTVGLAGASRQSVLGTGVWELWDRHWVLLAVQTGAFAVVLPFVRFGLLAAVLGALRLGRRPAWAGVAFRWAEILEPWAMTDVFLMGCVVGYTRVSALLPTSIDTGGWCLAAAATMAMVTDSALDRRSVWRLIAPERPWPAGRCLSCTSCDLVLPADRAGRRCPRCRARLWPRKVGSLQRTTALVLGGLMLYGPANLSPMTSTLRPSGTTHHTILRGIEELAHAHLWPLAVVVFAASIAIPLVKLLGLSWLVVSVRCRSRTALRTRTRLHRLIDRIGRWSNIDVFTIAVFSPLIQFDGVIWARAGSGADAFLLVVVLTMMASATFDPRLMWDASE